MKGAFSLTEPVSSGSCWLNQRGCSDLRSTNGPVRSAAASETSSGFRGHEVSRKLKQLFNWKYWPWIWRTELPQKHEDPVQSPSPHPQFCRAVYPAGSGWTSISKLLLWEWSLLFWKASHLKCVGISSIKKTSSNPINEAGVRRGHETCVRSWSGRLVVSNSWSSVGSSF